MKRKGNSKPKTPRFGVFSYGNSKSNSEMKAGFRKASEARNYAKRCAGYVYSLRKLADGSLRPNQLRDYPAGR